MLKKVLHPKATEQVIRHAKVAISALSRRPNSPLKDDDVLCVYLFGSIIRGDFIPIVSDVDVAVVYDGRDDEPAWQRDSFLQITQYLEEQFSKSIGCGIITRGSDVVTYTTEEIKNAREDWTRFDFFGPRKFLGIYSFDLVKNSLLIYGNEDIFTTVRVHSPEFFIVQRVNSIANNFTRAEKQEDLDNRLLALSTTIGESARVACLAWGLRSLHKMDVFHFVQNELPEFARKSEFLEFYQLYLDGIPLTEVVRRFHPFEVFCRELYDSFRSLALSRVL